MKAPYVRFKRDHKIHGSWNSIVAMYTYYWHKQEDGSYKQLSIHFIGNAARQGVCPHEQKELSQSAMTKRCKNVITYYIDEMSEEEMGEVISENFEYFI